MALYFLDLFGVAVFAVSGALTAGRKSMDLFGVVVVAVITAIGGGTVRDVLLDNRPIFWIDDATYLVVILGAAGATLVYGRFFTPPRGSLLVADAFGLALFTFIGARTAYAAGAPDLIVVSMGTITGAAGGMIRDVLCADVNVIVSSEIYSTASIAGGGVYVLLRQISPDGLFVGLLTAATVFAVRLAAIRFDLHVPPFHPKDELD